jgi:hypothetical protein
MAGSVGASSGGDMVAAAQETAAMMKEATEAGRITTQATVQSKSAENTQGAARSAAGTFAQAIPR